MNHTPAAQDPRPPPGPGDLGPPTDVQRLWSVLSHLSLFALPFIGPLIIVQTLGKRSPFVRYHAAEALNFHITVVIVMILIQLPGAMGFLHPSDGGWFLLLTITITFLLPIAVLVAATVSSIIAAVRSHEGR